MVNFATKTIGISACHPDHNAANWLPPTGPNYTPPPTHALRRTITDVEADPELNSEQDHIDIFNRVMLHKCQPGYCWPKSTARSRESCCFNFPQPLIGYQRGQEIEPTSPEDQGGFCEINRIPGKVTEGAVIEHESLKYLRNNPRAVENIPELLHFWRGNVDMKVVKNTPTLVNYIMKYITKPETDSMSFDEIVQQVSRNSEETEPVKKIVQKMMLSLVKEHDMSKNEAFKVISRKDYVLFS